MESFLFPFAIKYSLTCLDCFGKSNDLATEKFSEHGFGQIIFWSGLVSTMYLALGQLAFSCRIRMLFSTSFRSSSTVFFGPLHTNQSTKFLTNPMNCLVSTIVQRAISSPMAIILGSYYFHYVDFLLPKRDFRRILEEYGRKKKRLRYTTVGFFSPI